MSRYVQHISGLGAKWKVRYEYSFAWNVHRKLADESLDAFDLPKSEYCLCASPEQWMDITKDCEALFRGTIMHMRYNERLVVPVLRAVSRSMGFDYELVLEDGYRMTKIDLTRQGIAEQHGWAFIVEKKEPEPT